MAQPKGRGLWCRFLGAKYANKLGVGQDPDGLSHSNIDKDAAPCFFEVVESIEMGHCKVWKSEEEVAGGRTRSILTYLWKRNEEIHLSHLVEGNGTDVVTKKKKWLLERKLKIIEQITKPGKSTRDDKGIDGGGAVCGELGEDKIDDVKDGDQDVSG
ncbi:hypothetical protein L3X38_040723 [Prunus dulcis]|uniref:Uncharacterized protein n=1 Tax=Prunus dulcis TaxID=3755 RepID=A0AAD4USF3_PRUDU|nr:hypothetical protein L3X38_040723 [Prunus dulcis]